MNSNSALRIRILLSLLSIWTIVLFAKLYYVQVVKGDEYVKEADSQYSRPEDATFDRGSIFFESKNKDRISAATIKEGYNLIMNPKLVENPTSTYEALSQYIKIDKEYFFSKASKKNDQYEELVKRVDRNLGITIGELKIPGINVYKESWRVYPAGKLASQTIGFVGFDNDNEYKGRYGLERVYNSILDRNNGSLNINFFAELFSNIKGDDSLFQGKNKRGDIITTIDPTIQVELENILKSTIDEWKSDSIGGIIMDPQNGEIYAMATLPTFDPNNLKEISDLSVLSNHLVEDVYEMGSILKPLTIAAGIDKGVIKRDSTYDDTGFLLLNGKRISNFDGKARGRVSMQEILNQSLNIGAATVALKVGSEDFIRYFTSFGLGERTGIDQPNEQKGQIKNLSSGREIEQATASYGQGIALSPIATIRAMSILANGGFLIRPHIVKEINYTDGTVEKIDAGTPVPVIKKETTEEVTKMLVEVVDTALRKGEVKMDRYSIAAKTGTAQIADETNGGDYSDRYLHSFFGYFPAYSPRFIIFLYHKYPKGAQYASETLTNPFIELAKFLIAYYEIPPDRGEF